MKRSRTIIAVVLGAVLLGLTSAADADASDASGVTMLTPSAVSLPADLVFVSPRPVLEARCSTGGDWDGLEYRAAWSCNSQVVSRTVNADGTFTFTVRVPLAATGTRSARLTVMTTEDGSTKWFDHFWLDVTANEFHSFGLEPGSMRTTCGPHSGRVGQARLSTSPAYYRVDQHDSELKVRLERRSADGWRRVKTGVDRQEELIAYSRRTPSVSLSVPTASLETAAYRTKSRLTLRKNDGPQEGKVIRRVTATTPLNPERCP